MNNSNNNSFKKNDKVFIYSWQNFYMKFPVEAGISAIVRQNQIKDGSVLVYLNTTKGQIKCEVYPEQVSFYPRQQISLKVGQPVLVTSLGAHKHGGFLKREPAVVTKINADDSISVVTTRNFKGKYKLDEDFIVWSQQLIRANPEDDPEEWAPLEKYINPGICIPEYNTPSDETFIYSIRKKISLFFLMLLRKIMPAN